MWHLTKLKATNICAFERLNYEPIQNQATLVFGNNLDNESQNSNGSGKSALIEALAIGITGEPLRKVNADEIINDHFSEATVSIVLFNNETGQRLTVNRKLSRKLPQSIQILMQCDLSSEEVEIAQATVLDYNKYVLEQIGLSKDDILRNFILTARKYQSFLSSPDKDKKEIINRFSNGVMVDESIAALHADIEPVQKELLEVEMRVASCNGRVSALSEEIERYNNESAERKASRQANIERIKEAISSKRRDIRQLNDKREQANDFMNIINALDDEMQSLEKSDTDTLEAYKTIKARFDECNIPAISDYEHKISFNKSKLQEIKEQFEGLNESMQSSKSAIKDLEKLVKGIIKSGDKELADIEKKDLQLDNEISELQSKIKELKPKACDINSKRIDLLLVIADLEKKVAGIIQCPKCFHEFTLCNDVDIDKSKHDLKAAKEELEGIKILAKEVESSSSMAFNNTSSKRNEKDKLHELKLSIQKKCADAKSDLESAISKQSVLAGNMDYVSVQLKALQDSIANTRNAMFDEVFEAIDSVTSKVDQLLTSEIDNNIAMLEESIKAYEEQIASLENDADDVLTNLETSKAKYEQDLSNAEADKKVIKEKLDQLKLQESNFLEFKTYLANTKINAISKITNDFLKAIGSDIRIHLSGYTILKSGKVRDKISVSLIRDGVDCGSFDKFSAGEKCRVELASVLALHKLSNVNCEDGKGLNLLVIDEILDCTDESGLANVFKALNDTQVTALVVSHGNIAENYPNRLVITKQNGVSKINDQFKQQAATNAQ